MGALNSAPAGCRFFQKNRMSTTESIKDRVRVKKAELDARLATLDAFILDDPKFLTLNLAASSRARRRSISCGSCWASG